MAHRRVRSERTRHPPRRVRQCQEGGRALPNARQRSAAAGRGRSAAEHRRRCGLARHGRLSLMRSITGPPDRSASSTVRSGSRRESECGTRIRPIGSPRKGRKLGFPVGVVRPLPRQSRVWRSACAVRRPTLSSRIDAAVAEDLRAWQTRPASFGRLPALSARISIPHARNLTGRSACRTSSRTPAPRHASRRSGGC